ncbi:MAG: Na/Pi cotransporter family protein, partial [Nitrospirae bacterium]
MGEAAVIGPQEMASVLPEVAGPARAWWPMAMGLAGGVGLFILGMERMSRALQRLAGERLRDWLQRLTPNPYLGAVVGAGLTALVQSSS